MFASLLIGDTYTRIDEFIASTHIHIHNGCSRIPNTWFHFVFSGVEGFALIPLFFSLLFRRGTVTEWYLRR
jgi:hypothetical protein